VLLWVATAFGLIAGLSQTLGFLRWPFLVPHLAQSYLARVEQFMLPLQTMVPSQFIAARSVACHFEN
jgi:hypothetical protein